MDNLVLVFHFEVHDSFASLESPALHLDSAFDQVVEVVVRLVERDDALFRLTVDVFHVAHHEVDHLVELFL